MWWWFFGSETLLAFSLLSNWTVYQTSGSLAIVPPGFRMGREPSDAVVAEGG